MTWNLIWDDNFTNSPVSGSRAASFPTSQGGAGSTTGVLNGWIDKAGSTFNLPSSGVCRANNGSPNFATQTLRRPGTEDQQEARIVATSLRQSGTYIHWLRYNPSTGNGYIAYTTGSSLILALQGGATLASVSYNPGTRQFVTITFDVQDSPGPHPALVASIAYSGTGSGDDGGQTVSYTDTANTYLGVTGSYAISSNSAPIDWTHVQTYTTVSSASFVVAGPNAATTLPSNHASNITLTLTGTSTSWGGGTTFTVSGVSGWAKVSQNITSGTAATVVVSCPAAATPPAGTTGTLTVGDGSLTATIPVNTPTLSASPTHASAGSAPTLTMTGTNTLWLSETASGLFTVTGGTSPSFATPTVSTNTSATDVLTVGTSAGTLTLKDASTGATFSFTADAPSALASGTPIQVCTSAVVTIYLDGTNGSTAPSGGLVPYSYQWYASTTSNFTPGGGNILSGKTSQNLTVSGPTTTLTFYKCIVTDSQGTPATATTVEAPGRLFDVDLIVGFVGDSLYFNTPTSGNPPPTNFTQFSAYLAGRLHAVTVFNGGVSGTATADWLPTAAAWSTPPPTTGGANLLTWFEGQIVGYTSVIIRLGANDGVHAVSAATYGSNLGTIVTHLLANVTGLLRVLLDYPTYGRPAGSYGGSVNALFQQYQAQIDSLVNGTTIFAGDKGQWQASAITTGWRQDDIHPSAEGSRQLAEADILALANVLYPPAAGGGGANLIGNGTLVSA